MRYESTQKPIAIGDRVFAFGFVTNVNFFIQKSGLIMDEAMPESTAIFRFKERHLGNVRYRQQMDTAFMNYWEQISLSDQEISEALKEAKIRKYFKEKHRSYWESQEPKKVSFEQLGKQKQYLEGQYSKYQAGGKY